ncbi:uncharacterized protein NECHADRAFT_102239 [Fusarium vanettenii 77-13-4]|uniref:NAD-dependent epimerase/dehydratase domain-containing protein n=1 Tax=Fusarium vanettenii (strain ATCC MYA-4622 / CBS 123669 / FGSC 9596 / NRRL 45880 / 77-13-4) TaxID=660122 RepID=C7ZNA2_FUSV7|nr:uncharacterized protein NECHADRAFT_102239 [Fusarium vanettenii 77-13-4]EEU34487.1 hypothetical protein NECHADRAFT_102239 [Fusarium vanettenii 77-13-4]
MSTQLLVITGVSGHVGFRVLAEALSRGYKVRAVIRKPEQAQLIKSTESVKPYLSHLEFSVLPDLLLPGAFDGTLRGATEVIHVASPLPGPSDNYKRDLIEPAINATVGILKSAVKVPSIRRVVITSSIAALLTWEYITSPDTTRVFTVRDSYIPPGPDTPFENAMQAYAVSKASAFVATERFIEEAKPTFDIVNILPSMVIGKNELNRRREEVASGSNATAMGVLLTTTSDMPALGVSVHVDDVAKAHLDALNPALIGHRNYLCSSGGLEGTTWEQAKEIVRKHFSKEVADGTLPLAGRLPSRPIRLDSSETEKAFGWKFASFEAQVKSLVGHYLELSVSK